LKSKYNFVIELTFINPSLNETGRACVTLSTCPKKFFFNIFLLLLELAKKFPKNYQKKVGISKKRIWFVQKNHMEVTGSHIENMKN